VPLAGAFQVFSTQRLIVGIMGFGIGSGVPKLHPTSVQSGAVLLTGGAIEVGPIVQLEPVQLKREQACCAIRRQTLGDDGAAATDVQAAAGEVLDDHGGAILGIATECAASTAGGEVEERPDRRHGRRGRG